MFKEHQVVVLEDDYSKRNLPVGSRNNNRLVAKLKKCY